MVDGAYVGKRCLVFFCLGAVVIIITVLASIKTLGHDEQMLIEYLEGKEVINGPCMQVMNPFRTQTLRKATRLNELEFVRIKNTLNGSKRIVAGPDLVWLEAYDEFEGDKERKPVLNRDQFVRFVDSLTGNERVLVGARSVVPGAYEVSHVGVEQGAFVNQDSAVLVRNQATGVQRLIAPIGVQGEGVVTMTPGVWFPDAHEEVMVRRSLIRVSQHEAMVYRSHRGLYVVVSGASGGGTGTSFFLPPFCELVRMEWSSFSRPDGFSDQVISHVQQERIDMRASKSFFQYEVRTNDNVNLRIKGTITWKVVDPGRMILATSDAAGDVWHHSRSALIGAVSNNTLEEFTSDFNAIVGRAQEVQQTDGFYAERGIAVESMELIGYQCVDEEVAHTLWLTSQATVNRLNAMQVQQSANDIAHSRMDAGILLETTREQLIRQQSSNELLRSLKQGEAQGKRLATGAQTFLDGLVDSLPDMSDRVELYRLHKKLENQGIRTQQLSAAENAMLFFSPEDMALNLSYGMER